MTFRGVSPYAKRLLSSAELAMLISSSIIKKSHINILNNKGPEIESCGTPNKIASQEP